MSKRPVPTRADPSIFRDHPNVGFKALSQVQELETEHFPSLEERADRDAYERAVEE